MDSINILKCLMFLCLCAAWTSSGTGSYYIEATDTTTRPIYFVEVVSQDMSVAQCVNGGELVYVWTADVCMLLFIC